MGGEVSGEHQLYSWQHPQKTVDATNSMRKAFGGDDKIATVCGESKTCDVPNTSKERGFLQKAWDSLTKDGYK